MAAERVLLWRHGRTGHNLTGRFQGQLDVPLDDVGLQQAKLAAPLVAAVAGSPVRVVSSDLSRAAATAAALDLPVEPDPGLREASAGRWEGLLATEIEARWPEEYAAWRRGEDIPVGGAERRSEAADRALGAILRQIDATPSGTLVVVSHGAALRGALVRLIGLEHPAWTAFEPLRNCRWAELALRTRGWTLRTYNTGLPESEDPMHAAADSVAAGRSE